MSKVRLMGILMAIAMGLNLGAMSYRHAVRQTSQWVDEQFLAARYDAEIAIARCQGMFEEVNQKGSALHNLKKPGFFSSAKMHSLYRQKSRIIEAFERRMGDFMTFINDKIDLRLIKRTRRLKEKTMAYFRACQTFSHGLVDFINYAHTGTASDRVAQTVFDEWISHAR